MTNKIGQLLTLNTVQDEMYAIYVLVMSPCRNPISVSFAPIHHPVHERGSEKMDRQKKMSDLYRHFLLKICIKRFQMCALYPSERSQNAPQSVPEIKNFLGGHAPRPP